MLETRFQALNTDVRVWLWSTHPRGQGVLDSLPAAFEEVEAEFSRFRADSQLTRLNMQAGRGPRRVSALFAEVCGLALAAARETGGLFDPTILPALQAAGYGVTFNAVSTLTNSNPLPPPTSIPRWREVVVDQHSVSLPEGAALDFGGIAKGWAVDRVATMLRGLGPALVDAGGDLRATGAMAGTRWPVAIADPLHPGRALARVELEDEALVTSSVGRRRWQHGGRWMNHLIDPRTQLPTDSDLHSVSVLGASARDCEVHAKVALILGEHQGSSYLVGRGLEGVLLRHDGATRVIGTRLQSP